MKALYIIMIVFGVIIIGFGIFLGIKLQKRFVSKHQERISLLQEKKPYEMNVNEAQELSSFYMKKTFYFVGFMILGTLLGMGLAIAGIVLLGIS
ncbi:hypothetical protein LJC17_03145 [Acholeplasma sp. OttesenSCG-928-E16]|nr:hypothetical protein [Acholeplasma sp. OttesenSCG-928-E16]